MKIPHIPKRQLRVTLYEKRDTFNVKKIPKVNSRISRSQSTLTKPNLTHLVLPHPQPPRQDDIWEPREVPPSSVRRVPEARSYHVGLGHGLGLAGLVMWMDLDMAGTMW